MIQETQPRLYFHVNTRSYHRALQSLPAGPTLSLSLSRYRIGPELFFGPGRTWQDRPWPVLFMLAHGNAIWLVWMITTATAGWPAASRNQGHSTSALRTFPALFSSACRWIIHPVQPQRHESTAQTPPYPQKKLHTQFTDIITCNEKINVSAWTAKINSSQMSSDIAGMRLLYGRGRWNQL